MHVNCSSISFIVSDFGFIFIGSAVVGYILFLYITGKLYASNIYVLHMQMHELMK